MASTTDNFANALDVHSVGDYIEATAGDDVTLTIKGDFDGYFYGRATVGTATATWKSAASGATAITMLALDAATSTTGDVVARMPLKNGDEVNLAVAGGATGFVGLRVTHPQRG